ncbi:MAG: bifunctional diaminohydroxyphosphoribosylaminopyrimidine deaminase/5-amino-6-(5-phosphoribosylamino)uracil reductase RibD, partial [Pseudomonadota bacterium]
HALALAARGLGQVWPWPSVGCVLVREGRVVGRGTSDPDTLRHAERVALNQAGDAARGATAYVTLEPCSHHGRTPPCADALIAAGVARVVVATGDPNPQVSGQGLVRLQAAGVEVATGIGQADADEQHKGFFLVQRAGRPMVTLKLATTLDGRIATATGESRWITGPDARRAVHALRMRHDAVLVGAGTARADDPTLTVRDMGAVRQPVRIVASRRLGLPWPNRLVGSLKEGPVWLAHGAGEVAAPDLARWRDAGVTLIEVPVTDGQLDPGAMLSSFASAGLTRIFCEGGGMLAASLLVAGLVDELIVITAGLALGAEGQPALGPLGVSTLAEAERFQLQDVTSVGGDVMQCWVRAPGA